MMRAVRLDAAGGLAQGRGCLSGGEGIEQESRCATKSAALAHGSRQLAIAGKFPA